jgi:hypothetical protein
VRLEIVLISAQHQCTVWGECTIGSEIILDTPVGILDDVDQMETWFGLFGDSANIKQDMCMVCVERANGLEIILGIPDGTPRSHRSIGRSLRSAWRSCQTRRQIDAGFVSNIPRAWKCWSHLMDLLGDGVKSKLILVYSEIVLINMQDRCMVCTKRAIGSKILLGRTDGTPR